MLHTIENQQILSNTQTVEKVQQSRQETLIAHQQNAETEMKQKEMQNQREVAHTNETENAIIRDREGRQQKKKKRAQKKKDAAEQEMLLEEQSKQKLDVLA